MSQRTRQQIALQLHYNYYVGLKFLNLLTPEDETHYLLAMYHERQGLVAPLSLEDQIVLVESKVTDEVSTDSDESVFIEDWGVFFRRGDGWHGPGGFYGPSTPMARQCEEASKAQRSK